MSNQTVSANGPKFSRAITIFLSKNGVFQFARQGTRQHKTLLKQGFLPATSVDTLDEAESIQVGLCRLSYDGKLYIYPMESTLEGLDRAGREIEQLYQHRRAGKSGYPNFAEVK